MGSRKVIFCEDDQFLMKLKMLGVVEKDDIILKYERRRVLSIEINRKNVSLFRMLWIFYSSDKFICEYANFLPRLFSFLFFKPLESHIFGLLDIANIKNVNPAWIAKYIKPLIPLQADKYIFYTPSLAPEGVEKINHAACVKSIQHDGYIRRMAREIIGGKDSGREKYVAWIGQPFLLNEMEFIHDHMIETLSKLKRAGVKIIYCSHPRENDYERRKVEEVIGSNAIVHGMSGLMSYMRKNGAPVKVFSYFSSLGFELNDMGFDVLFLSDNDNRKKIKYSSDEVLHFVSCGLIKSGNE